MFRRIFDLLRAVWGPTSGTLDGYGQSWVDDARSAKRFRSLSRSAIVWQSADDWPGDVNAAYPILLDRFGDGIVGWYRAKVSQNFDSNRWEDWFVIDRMWHGFPDPPEFAFMAFDASGKIISGHDFDDWPASWIKPVTPS
jgi:hypothetical protein